MAPPVPALFLIFSSPSQQMSSTRATRGVAHCLILVEITPRAGAVTKPPPHLAYLPLSPPPPPIYCSRPLPTLPSLLYTPLYSSVPRWHFASRPRIATQTVAHIACLSIHPRPATPTFFFHGCAPLSTRPHADAAFPPRRAVARPSQTSGRNYSHYPDICTSHTCPRTLRDTAMRLPRRNPSVNRDDTLRSSPASERPP